MLSPTPNIFVYSWSHATMKEWSDAYVLLKHQRSAIYKQLEDLLIISTCHRTTFISGRDCLTEVIDQMLAHTACHRKDLERQCCVFSQEDAWQHLISVASGLDSMVLGEVEVMGQFKNALKHREAIISPTLLWHMQQITKYAKKIRYHSALGEEQVSLTSVSIMQAQLFFNELTDVNVTIIGAGDLAGQMARALSRRGVKSLTIMSRRYERAQKLANEVGGHAIDMAQIATVLEDTDWLIAAVSSTMPVIGKGMMETIMAKRHERQMFCLDLSMPSGIEPQVSAIPNVHNKQLMDLEPTLKKSWQSRSIQANQAKSMLAESIEGLQQEWLMHQAGSVIHAMRASQSKHLENIIQAHLPQNNDQANVLKHKLLQASLHMPTKWLRNLVEQKQFDTISSLVEANHHES